MTSISFSDASGSISGTTGKIYLFGLSSSNIYKIQEVLFSNTADASKLTNVQKTSLNGLIEYSISASASSGVNVAYHFSGNILYVYLKTAYESVNNRLTIKYKRGYRTSSSLTSTFDLHDSHIGIFIYLVKKIYCDARGIRVKKNIQLAIQEFNDKHPPENNGIVS